MRPEDISTIDSVQTLLMLILFISIGAALIAVIEWFSPNPPEWVSVVRGWIGTAKDRDRVATESDLTTGEIVATIAFGAVTLAVVVIFVALAWNLVSAAIRFLGAGY